MAFCGKVAKRPVKHGIIGMYIRSLSLIPRSFMASEAAQPAPKRGCGNQRRNLAKHNKLIRSQFLTKLKSVG